MNITYLKEELTKTEAKIITRNYYYYYLSSKKLI